MGSVFGFFEHVARFGEDGWGQLRHDVDRALCGEKIRLCPLLPRLERLVADTHGKTHAEAQFEMESRNRDGRTAREVRAIFSERPVRRLVFLADA